MAFMLSKLVQFVAQPLNLVIALLLLGFLFGRLKWTRLAFTARAVALGFSALVLLTPMPEALLGRLENRFPAPPPGVVDQAAGAIILGGSTGDGVLAEERDTWILSEAAERLTAMIALRHQRPDIVLLHAGGTARVFHEGWREAQIVEKFVEGMGLDPTSILYEDRSRNTYENAQFSRELLQETYGDEMGGAPWLLVTSAWHMPRAVAAFRKAGITVIPYPVDFWAREPSWRLDRMNFYERLRLMTRAMMEYVGLLGYRVTGRSDELFPAP